MERKKRSKGSVWEFCYANKIFGTFGFEMKVCGKKLVKFCGHTHTHTRGSISSKDVGPICRWAYAYIVVSYDKLFFFCFSVSRFTLHTNNNAEVVQFIVREV